MTGNISNCLAASLGAALNAAKAIFRENEVGSLMVGKKGKVI